MNLFELFVKLGIDDDDLEKGLDKAKSAVGAAGKAMATGFAAAAAGATALVAQSVNAYKDYEQLVGGVETLFSNLEGTVSAAPAVLAKANEAFKTAGMSANQYMETVTSFSAALISSLEGDYDKAAEISDIAITDMADNANKMGSSLESLQTAYAGFAKQNYTMLDNLKLGYGGTKEEMERLLKDAERFSGVKYDISNLSDVYEAIHVVQEQMGIAGATAAEAATTIEGSFNALKGAWENLVTGFSNKDADLSKLVTDVVDSATVAFKNLKPVVETAISGLIESVESFTPIIGDMLPTLINDLLPRVIDAAQSIVNTLAIALPDMLKVIVDLIPNLTTEIVQTISDLAPELVNVGADMIDSLADGLSETLPDLIPIAVDAILNFTDSLIDNLDTVVDAAIKIILALAEGLGNALPKLIAKAPEILIKLGTAFVENIDKIQKVPEEIIKKIADTLVHHDWRKTAEEAMNNLINALDVAQKKVQLFLDDVNVALGGESLYNGDIANVGSTDFIAAMREGTDDVVDAIGDTADALKEGYDSYYGVVEEGNKKVADGYYTMTSDMSEYAKGMQQQADNWKKSAKSLNNAVVEAEIDEKEMEAQLKSTFADLETQMYRSGFSEEWLVHQKRKYVEALDHSTELYKEYDLKLLKEEDKITKAADKEWATQQKNAVERRFAELEKTAITEHKTEAWLVKQERMFLETLDHNSELYEEYNMKLLKAEKKIDDAANAEREKRIKENQKKFSDMVKSIKDRFKKLKDEYQKAVDDIKSKMKSFGESLTKSYTDMFSFETDEKTGKVKATKTKDFLANATKELEKYYANIQNLRSRKVSDSLLNQLTSMSAEEGAAVAEYWASLSDSQLKALDDNWKKYEATGQKISESLYSDEMADAEKQYDEERNTLLGEIKQEIADNADTVTSAIASIFSGMTGNVQINVAGMPVIKKGINEMLATIKNSGGVIDV